MLEYRPWASSFTKSIIERATSDLPILDIQLGGGCNLRCRNCDTPSYKEPCLIDLEMVDRLMDEAKTEFVFICGKGEPIFGENLIALKTILSMCEKRHIGLSMFSNIVGLDDELIGYIKNGTLNVIYKMDSFDANVLEDHHQVNRSADIFRNTEKIEKLAVVDVSGTTNLGASIVPMSINAHECFSFIDRCMSKNVFPLVGELEEAGLCTGNTFDRLNINQSVLAGLKSYVLERYDPNYSVPVCPSTIGGIHITNRNQVTVDYATGLSCGWFTLGDQKAHIIGDARYMSYNEIKKAIFNCRIDRISNVRYLLESTTDAIFGGCGGMAKTLLAEYLSMYS
jgi:hypothetical protein